jgi:fatty acid desaturase
VYVRSAISAEWEQAAIYRAVAVDVAMGGVNVRRLAAIDMYGSRGTMRRRRIILAELTAGAIVMVAFGAWLAAASTGLGDRVLAIWIVGAGLNYVPLAAYAIALSLPGALVSRDA